jgi:superoxide dismutase, Fe-Mn family
MSYDIKPLPFDPKNIKGLSEKLLVSHYENNYSGAVKRLNTLTAQLAELDFAKAPVFVINGLKREELIAANSMILHELYFDGLGESGAPSGTLADAIARDFGSIDRWRAEFVAMVPSRFVLELIDAVSGRVRILDQAARSIGLSASFWVRVCQPSSLRMVI